MPKATAILAALSWTWAAGGGSGGGREETAATVTAEAVAVGMVVAVAGLSQAGGGGAPKNKPFGSNPFAQGDPFAHRETTPSPSPRESVRLVFVGFV